MKMTLLIASVALAGLATVATAQHSGHPAPKSGHEAHKNHTGADSSASTAAYQAANDKMHTAMDIPFTGDADRDFIAGMIAHHQGAIDMANVVIKFGKDPGVRKLAEEIIQAQDKEIAWMKEWQTKNAK
ncbi:CopM family metallochaperone [Leptospira interrogans]